MDYSDRSALASEPGGDTIGETWPPSFFLWRQPKHQQAQAVQAKPTKINRCSQRSA